MFRFGRCGNRRILCIENVNHFATLCSVFTQWHSPSSFLVAISVMIGLFQDVCPKTHVTCVSIFRLTFWFTISIQPSALSMENRRVWTIICRNTVWKKRLVKWQNIQKTTFVDVWTEYLKRWWIGAWWPRKNNETTLNNFPHSMCTKKICNRKPKHWCCRILDGI